MRRIVVGLVVVGLLGAGLPAAQAESGDGSIAGRVTDAEGQPIRNICVDAWWDDGDDYGYGYARTDRRGGYRMSVGPGSYMVRFSDCRYPRRYASQYYDGKDAWHEADLVTVGSGQAVTGIDAVLLRTGSVSGTVTDEQGGPLEGACFTAEPADLGDPPGEGRIDVPLGPWRVTGPDGRYTLAGMSPGDYHVGFYGCGDTEDYTGIWHGGSVERHGAVVVTVISGQDTPGIDGALRVGGRISGSVVASDGGALEGACVSAWQAGSTLPWYRWVDTAIDGSYTLRGLQGSPTTVGFFDCGSDDRPWNKYLPQYYNGVDDPVDASPVDVVLGQETTGIDAVLKLSGAITGTVSSAIGRDLDACIRVEGTDGSWGGWAWTEDGTYEIWGLRSGTYVLHVRECGWPAYHRSQWYDGADSEEDATPIAVTVGEQTSGIDVVLQLGPAPDPAVTSITVQGGSEVGAVETGVGRSVSVTVENLGTRANEEGGRLYVRACPVSAGGCSYVGSAWVDEMGIGESQEFTYRWPFVAGSGDYEVVATLDAWDDVDESNNEARTTQTVHLDLGGEGVGVF